LSKKKKKEKKEKKENLLRFGSSGFMAEPHVSTCLSPHFRVARIQLKLQRPPLALIALQSQKPLLFTPCYYSIWHHQFTSKFEISKIPEKQKN
jgi:hypothetical protein